MTGLALSGHEERVEDVDHWLRSMVFAGLVGIGFLLNLDNTTQFLGSFLVHQVAAVLSIAGLTFLWVLILASLFIRLLRHAQEPPREHSPRQRRRSRRGVRK